MKHTRSVVWGLAIAFGTVMVVLSVLTKLYSVEGWYEGKCYERLSRKSEGYLYFNGGLIWGVTFVEGKVYGSNIGWYRNFKGRQYEAYFWDLYGYPLYKTQGRGQGNYSTATTRMLVQTGCRGIKVLERTGENETSFMTTFSPRVFSPLKKDKRLTIKIHKQDGRLILDGEA